MLEVAEGICTVQGLQTLFSSDPVANSPRRCCPAGLLLGQTAQRAVGRRAPRSVLGGGAGSALAPQASSSVRRRPACERRMGPSAAAPVSVPGCVRPVPAPGPGLLQATGRRALLGLLLPPCLVPRTPQLLSGCPPQGRRPRGGGCPQQAPPAISHQQVCLSDPFPEYFQLPWVAMLWVH